MDADAVLVSPMVLAEVDYMITTRFGLKAALGFSTTYSPGFMRWLAWNCQTYRP